MDDAQPKVSPKELAHIALQANKDHQYVLKVYAERLEAELSELDKLISSVEAAEEAANIEVLDIGTVSVPGARKPESLIPPSALLNEQSPFYKDALWRQQYVDFITSRPMRTKEHEALADAIRSENVRMAALEAQERGQQPFSAAPVHPPEHYEINTENINWQRVARQVSSAIPGGVARTSEDCKIRWLGNRHPHINHNDWTPDEIDKLKQLVQGDEHPDWVKIAEQLGTHRTPVDCMLHGASRKNHTWDAQSDDKLLEAVRLYGVNNWSLVARMVSEDANGHQCQKRWQDTVEPNIKRGNWSSDEDNKLRSAVEAFGNSWQDVALFVPGRTNNQCRERWQDRLSAKAKGRWTTEEDDILVQAVIELGRSNWKKIADKLGGGRSGQMCRRRYDFLSKGQSDTDASQQLQKSNNLNEPQQELNLATSNISTSAALPKRKRNREATEDVIHTSATSSLNPKVAKARPRPRRRILETDGEQNSTGETVPEQPDLNTSTATLPPIETHASSETAVTPTLDEDMTSHSMSPMLGGQDSISSNAIYSSGAINVENKGETDENVLKDVVSRKRRGRPRKVN